MPNYFYDLPDDIQELIFIFVFEKTVVKYWLDYYYGCRPQDLPIDYYDEPITILEAIAENYDEI